MSRLEAEAAAWAPTAAPGRASRGLDLASALVMTVVAVIGVATVDDYGYTWDEVWHVTYGDHILEWFATLGRDRSALSYRLDFFYGGTYDLLGAVVRRWSPWSALDTMHRLGLLFGVLGLAGAWRLARRLGGAAAGLVAVVLLATTPVFYGHMFSNPKDLPFATGYIWTLDALCAVVMGMPRVPRRRWIRLSAIAGLAMGVRIAGLIPLAIIGVVVLDRAVRRARRSGSAGAGLAVLRRHAPWIAGTVAGAWTLMVLPWPWAQLDPLRRPWAALGRMSRFTAHHRRMPFAGESMLTTEPRADYLLHYFGLKLPLLVLGLAAVALGLAIWAWWRARERADPTRRALALVLAAAIVVPPAYAIAVRAVVYDGLRHFLFLVPPLAVAAALAAVLVARRLGRLGRAWRAAVAVPLAGGAAAAITGQLVAMHQLHPHQYVYFNALVGGLPGADGDYDTDYYGHAYREGFAALERYLWRHEPERYLESRYRVSGCIAADIARQYLGLNFVWVEPFEGRADFDVSYTRSGCHLRHEGRPVIVDIARQGTTLLLVRDLRAAPRAGDSGRSSPARGSGDLPSPNGGEAR